MEQRELETPEIFRPMKNGGPELVVSTLDEPLWQHDGDELSLVVIGRSEGYVGEPGPIWVSIGERNHYCDRGHFLVKIHGINYLHLNDADFRPNYYMTLEAAKDETIRFLRWRILKQRQDKYGQIRNLART